MNNIEISQVATLPTKYGTFKIQAFKEADKEHLAIFTENIRNIGSPIVRVHSECLTGDTLGSLKCDCGEQLQGALQIIAEEGGMLIYHRQEGRNIGLLNKVNAYVLQDQGLDTVAANHQLGFKTDERTYGVIQFIFEHFQIKKIKLLTNNPDKVRSLKMITIDEIMPLITEPNPHNQEYLNTKKSKMGHIL
ncbi:MAG: GTP cyclohydrolase II [Sulfurovum sp.]|nr:GTP cyclohydrolase II [Sulfurovum sp.]